MKKRISMNCVSYFIISIAIIFSASASAQTNYANLWNEISEVGLNAQGTRYIIPQSYRTLELDLQGLSSALSQVPKESNTQVNNSGFILSSAIT